MNKPLPEVSCNKCFRVQTYTGQKDCKSCGKNLVVNPPWTGKRS